MFDMAILIAVVIAVTELIKRIDYISGEIYASHLPGPWFRSRIFLNGWR